MHSSDAHHHHHHHHHQHLIKETINREANAPTSHSNVIGEPRDQTCKQLCAALIFAFVMASAMCFVIASISMALCPNKGNYISASVSLAESDDDYHNSTAPPSTTTTNTTLLAFNVHIKLGAYDGQTRYGNTTVSLRHANGTDIDEFPIAGARIRFGATRDFNVPLRMVISRRRLCNGSDPVVSGGGGGVLRLQTHVRFSGKVRWIARWPVNEVNCDLLVDVESRTLAYTECKPKSSCKAKAA